MPMSASLMAMISLAPSPTMATFSKVLPNSLSHLLFCFLSTFFISMSFLTTRAFDSGVILANIFVYFGMKGHIFKNPLSIATVIVLVFFK